MKKEIIDRVLNESEYILKTKETIREVAKKFGISKSTVHIDLTMRLKQIDEKLFIKIKEILSEHTALRHIRGGESTRLKYALKK